jgi:hypothetical protein
MLLLINIVASIPLEIQKMIVRFLEPIMLGGLAYGMAFVLVNRIGMIVSICTLSLLVVWLLILFVRQVILPTAPVSEAANRGDEENIIDSLTLIAKDAPPLPHVMSNADVKSDKQDKNNQDSSHRNSVDSSVYSEQYCEFDLDSSLSLDSQSWSLSSSSDVAAESQTPIQEGVGSSSSGSRSSNGDDSISFSSLTSMDFSEISL